jgi:hypothetical protein
VSEGAFGDIVHRFTVDGPFESIRITVEGAMTAADAFERGKGGSQDFAHLFIAAARAIGAPARYVSGYCLRHDRERIAAYAWAEAWSKIWAGSSSVQPMASRPANGMCVSPSRRII